MSELRQKLARARLYGIVDMGYTPFEAVEEVTQIFVQSGIDIIQLRAKKCGEKEITTLVEKMLPICRSKGVPFILNDYPELAEHLNCDGVHVGQDDLSLAEVRKRVAPHRLIGKSTHSLEQARLATLEQPDYIGFGPLFATATKPDYEPVSLAPVKAVHEAVQIPIFCIGGVQQDRLPLIVAAGAKRLVVVSHFLLAKDIKKTILQFKEEWARLES
jgi:thiamine-phosphate pyrophosphorylase